MNDFYVTLPSSVKNAQFENTSSRYVTRLPQVLHLEKDEYSVAVTDIIYPYSFVNLGRPLNYWIHFKNREPINVTFPAAQYDDLPHVVNSLNGVQKPRMKRGAPLILENEQVKRPKSDEPLSERDVIINKIRELEAKAKKDEEERIAREKEEKNKQREKHLATHKKAEEFAKKVQTDKDEQREKHLDTHKKAEQNAQDNQKYHDEERKKHIETQKKAEENEEKRRAKEKADRDAHVARHKQAEALEKKKREQEEKQKNEDRERATQKERREHIERHRQAEARAKALEKEKHEQEEKQKKENLERAEKERHDHIERQRQAEARAKALEQEKQEEKQKNEDRERATQKERREHLERHRQAEARAKALEKEKHERLQQEAKDKEDERARDKARKDAKAREEAKSREDVKAEKVAIDPKQVVNIPGKVYASQEAKKIIEKVNELEKQERDKIVSKVRESEAIEKEAVRASSEYHDVALKIFQKPNDRNIYDELKLSFERIRSRIKVSHFENSSDYLQFGEKDGRVSIDFLDSNILFEEFEKSCAYFLGFHDTIVRESSLAPSKIDYFGNVSTIYLYCDIVDPIIVGDSKNSLLSVIPCKGKYGEMIHHTIPHPRYLPIMNSTIDSIKIELLSEFAEPINFNWGSTVIVLHFKKI
ncbi:MSP domain-containing protein [Caenorhabditis elegans]|uniref:MSP domain-containing protein n=1 Tax=Caenorhabditis elegans TaxID=6239 RepID=O18244_CAEEL|nr:MSP domain-containing protein [Caenorhabditis elegans]CAB16521.1 MSP domain-containing protein [Caenorhabditis elegans]|eukprot:NP_502799.1 Uncharacterized protein CELE_Y57G11C.20 [Caenorhabditis elegans]